MLREIKWLRMTYNCWRRNHPKYKGEMDNSSLTWCSLSINMINGVKRCWQYPYAPNPGLDRLILQQTTNPVSCAVKFLYVCPFLHHRLPFRQISKTMCFVGRFCCFKICSFHAFARSPHAWHHFFFFFYKGNSYYTHSWSPLDSIPILMTQAEQSLFWAQMKGLLGLVRDD